MTPQIIAFYEGAPYARLARVLAYSAAQCCPTWDRQIRDVTMYAPRQRTVEQRVRLDSAKLLKWTEAVEQAADDTPMLLIDCDVMILRSLKDVWDRAFDVAVTVRDPARTILPLNAGVVFVRANAASRRFLRTWYTTTQPIRRSPEKVKQARKRYGACDQAGLVATLAHPRLVNVAVRRLPCHEWNCEDSEWSRFDAARTRLVHIKGALRRAVFGQPISEGRKPSVLPLAARWHELERAALLQPEAVPA